MTIQEWLQEHEAEIAAKMVELKAAHPNATIVPPGPVTAIDGKTYFNDMFIIGG